MSLLDKLSDAECWERFYEYKLSLACPKQFAVKLREFIDGRGYTDICGRIERGERFPLPRRAVISKLDTGKKRVIYIYPEAESTVLKLLTHLLLRRYDGVFSDGLYSFRPARTAQMAMRRFARTPMIGQMYCYKADISNYFNSVDITLLLPMLREVTAGDERLYSFLSALLTEPMVTDKGIPVAESKGIMAGTPLSAFYANLFLKGLDEYFEREGIPYARYSDDIILFARTQEETERYAQTVREYLADRGLRLNPAKESFSRPGEGWTFLGLSYSGGQIDIAPSSVKKLKAKMRRKARALKRWHERRGLSGEKAAAAFIRIFERKLFEAGRDSELSWAYWYFPIISTDRSLREIDSYAQDCIRSLISGSRGKSRYRVRYRQLKALGYKTCVHEYHLRQRSSSTNCGS